MYHLYIGNSPPYIIYVLLKYCPGSLLLVKTETNTSSCNCRFILVDTLVSVPEFVCSCSVHSIEDGPDYIQNFKDLLTY